MRRRCNTPTGPFTVGGDKDGLPTAGSAFSRAISRVTRTAGEVQLGVYRDDVQIGRVVKLPNGVIETQTASGAAR